MVNESSMTFVDGRRVDGSTWSPVSWLHAPVLQVPLSEGRHSQQINYTYVGAAVHLFLLI
jgi:hypothetical protein